MTGFDVLLNDPIAQLAYGGLVASAPGGDIQQGFGAALGLMQQGEERKMREAQLARQARQDEMQEKLYNLKVMEAMRPDMQYTVNPITGDVLSIDKRSGKVTNLPVGQVGAQQPMKQPQAGGMLEMPPLPSGQLPVQQYGVGATGISPKSKQKAEEANIDVAKSLAVKRGEADIKKEANLNARERITNNLKKVAGYYNTLSEEGAIVDPESDTIDNLLASIRSSYAGQAMGRMVGTYEQTIRDNINQIRPTLLNDIRQATEMGAKGLDSEKELEFYLQAVTDPSRSIQSNMEALRILNKAYGLGGANDLGESNTSARIRLQKEFEDTVSGQTGIIDFNSLPD